MGIRIVVKKEVTYMNNLQQQTNGEPERQAKLLYDWYVVRKHPTEADLKLQRDLQPQTFENKK